ncbi:cytochrome P450 [Streptomyces muensis]|uniref:Cytochrome P450 n=1 Tax=Streptomyces muensis TaxID=1077944 RepID=A0A9X1PRU8_STRM4|nr:cytochrome P450 [Streptomyces muensis]MCF1592352.1 cytochrome P450 [Streptomyces muensis]
MVRVTSPTGIEAWLVTRYSDVREVLGDPDRFSNRSGQVGHVLANTPPDAPVPAGWFARMDGAEHLRFRRLLGPELSVKRMERLRPAVQLLVDERIDALAETAPPVDLYQGFAVPLTSSIIAELLGVPAADRPVFQKAAATLFDRNSDVEETEAAMAPLFSYVGSLVEQRRHKPGDDLISRLITRGTGGEQPFSDTELAVSAAGLLIAGFDTTASMISYGMLALLHHSDQLALLRADPSLIPGAVEELVRYLGVGTGLMREATRDTEIAGQRIAAGDFVIAAAQAANHDVQHLPDADRLDVTRASSQHIGFGYGPHQCVGQQLARVELKVVLETLQRRIPTLRLAVPFEQIEFKTDAAVTGPAALPVAWDSVLPAGR